MCNELLSKKNFICYQTAMLGLSANTHYSAALTSPRKMGSAMNENPFHETCSEKFSAFSKMRTILASILQYSNRRPISFFQLHHVPHGATIYCRNVIWAWISTKDKFFYRLRRTRGADFHLFPPVVRILAHFS